MITNVKNPFNEQDIMEALAIKRLLSDDPKVRARADIDSRTGFFKLAVLGTPVCELAQPGCGNGMSRDRDRDRDLASPETAEW